MIHNHLLSLAAPALMMAATATLAHHSPALFDTSRNVTLEGVIRSYRWANPHVYFDIDVEGPDGSTTTWKIEASWPADLTAFGVGRDTFEAGETVWVTGNPARNPDRHYLLGRYLIKEDGPRLVLNGIGVQVDDYISAEAQRETLPARLALVGTWLPLNPRQFPFTLPSPLLNAQGRALAETESNATSDDLRAECVPYSPPFTMVLEGVRGFETRGDDIVIRDASVGNVERVVHVDTAAHAPSDPADMQGHSLGRWDGDALVLETVFNSGEKGTIVFGVPFSGTRLEERFELSRDRSALKYRYSLDNPDYLRLPFSGSVDWAFRPDLEVPTLECDPENARDFRNAG